MAFTQSGNLREVLWLTCDKILRRMSSIMSVYVFTDETRMPVTRTPISGNSTSICLI